MSIVLSKSAIEAATMIVDDQNLLKPENRSKDETNAGGPRILALGRAVQGVCHLSELAHIPRARPA